MTLEENKKLVLDHYEALYWLDADAVKKQLAADFVDHEAMYGSMPPGPDAVLLAFESVLRAVPDLRVEVEDIVAEGDLVAVRGTWTGTHKAPLPRIRDGQIVERWGNLDRLSLQKRLSAET